MTVPFLNSSRQGSRPENTFRLDQGPYPSHSIEETVLAGKRVVIVEDEGIVQMHLRKLLTRAGLQVVGYALNGADAISTVLNDRPDLVIMDINMPGTINGLDAARRILSEYRVCIVMVTAYRDFQEEAEQLGASGYLTKPVESATLLVELRRAWQRFAAP